MHTGAIYKGNGKCLFRVWSQFSDEIQLRILGEENRDVKMNRESNDYWTALVEDVHPGTLYYFLQDGTERPDPASVFQPEGVHGPSQVIDMQAYKWNDQVWNVMPLRNMIVYELHIGTFSPDGTFEGLIKRLDYLKELGVNTLELMPISQFPGSRNWGYDGAYPYAVQNSYGSPDQLKHLIDVCHQHGFAVILDVVYNHLGPEGNYLGTYASYFTDKYKTPWGQAINFDDEWSDHVREYFIQNALYWLREYHIDGLRLDAVHAIYDFGATNFFKEMTDEVEEFSARTGRKHYLIAESALNDHRLINSPGVGGYGLHAQWSDDFHHALHALLTGETDGYYIDFGNINLLAKVLETGYSYTGEYSEFRKRKFGSSPKLNEPDQFVFFIQNHDQVGNRMMGERLSRLIPFEAQKLAVAVLLTSPYVPMLFMGEEYGEENPFLYFVSHSDKALIKAVQEGRAAEFESFKWKGEVPDPQSEETYDKSKPQLEKRSEGNHLALFNLYKYLIDLRRKDLLGYFPKRDIHVNVEEKMQLLTAKIHRKGHVLFMVLNFHAKDTQKVYLPDNKLWVKKLDTSDNQWNGPGSAINERYEKGGELMVRNQSMVLLIKSVSSQYQN